MLKPNTATGPDLRTFLVLGRVSNLPTVWSNCLAGWLLGGGGEAWRFLWLGLGATFLYTGGMYLNDAFDADFDRRYRRERPIPSGKISAPSVWRWGFGSLALGTAMLLAFGETTLLLSVVLAGLILIYDAVHKAVTLSPVLMAACRFFLFVTAASASTRGVTGLAVWSGLALATYVAGLSYLARKESTRGPLRNWPVHLLAAPIALALVVNAGESRLAMLGCGALLAVWIARCLCATFWTADRKIGRTVSGLLAGIVLVDLLAVLGGPPEMTLVFAALFAAALLFQKIIPAT